MIHIRKSEQRGLTEIDWLNSDTACREGLHQLRQKGPGGDDERAARFGKAVRIHEIRVEHHLKS